MSDKKPRKSTTGRGGAYKEAHPETAYKVCLLGLKKTDQLAEFFNVTETTIYRWCKRYPDFADAIKRGAQDANGNVAQSLYNRAIGVKTTEVTEVQNIVEEELTADEIKRGLKPKRIKRITRTIVTKEYPPETAACRYWLNNREYNLWRNTLAVLPPPPDKPPMKTIKGPSVQFPDDPIAAARLYQELITR